MRLIHTTLGATLLLLAPATAAWAITPQQLCEIARQQGNAAEMRKHCAPPAAPPVAVRPRVRPHPTRPRVNQPVVSDNTPDTGVLIPDEVTDGTAGENLHSVKSTDSSDRDITFHNFSGQAIENIYYRSVTSNNWGDDELGQQTLESYHNVKWSVDDGSGQCSYAFKFVLADNSVRTVSNLNVCTASNIYVPGATPGNTVEIPAETEDSASDENQHSVRSSDSSNRSITIHNFSLQAIENIYYAKPSATVWGEDELGTEILDYYHKVSWSIDDGSGNCNFDFRIVMADNTVKEVSNLNVCSASDLYVPP